MVRGESSRNDTGNGVLNQPGATTPSQGRLQNEHHIGGTMRVEDESEVKRDVSEGKDEWLAVNDLWGRVGRISSTRQWETHPEPLK